MNASPTTAVLPTLKWQPSDPIPAHRIVQRQKSPPGLIGLDVYEYPPAVAAQAWASAQREEAACLA
jgi:hypothetical protein